MLERVGYTFDVVIEKHRRKAHFGNYELCVDRVKDLGDFIEIEKMVDESANVDDVTDELWQVLEGFGVSEDVRYAKGYDTLMRMKLGKEPNQFDWLV